MTEKSFDVVQRRDSYGFALRPQHVQTYREYASIFKEEEAERVEKWKNFLELQESSAQSCSSTEEHQVISQTTATESKEETASEEETERDDSRSEKFDPDSPGECEVKKDLQHPKDSIFEEPVELPEDSQPAEEVQLSKESDLGKKEQLPQESEAIKEVKLPEESEPVKEVQLPEESEPVKEVQRTEEGQTGKDNRLWNESESEKEEPVQEETKARKIQEWAQIRPSLAAIEEVMGSRVKRANVKKNRKTGTGNHLSSTNGAGSFKRESDENAREDTCVSETSYGASNASENDSDIGSSVSPEPFFPWKEELVVLVHLGVPKDLRGEVWQAFVGVKARRVERYYQDLLAQVMNSDESTEQASLTNSSRKWKRQIEKDIPRTFPGHPALSDDGRDSLRRILLAYAYHNPLVGYCQAMNFFAGLLLLLMPEENAFWTFMGLVDDYFEGYYTEEMIESQVDQLVFEELIRERFPKLVNHLDYLGVQVAWISGPWFLSIFVNVLPWESVLRIWDVLLFEGNRVMLFRTALAMMELYGPALLTTKDAGDAITLLQNLASSTFDSSQLVLTADMGNLAVTESILQELRVKHRPAVLEVVEERAKMGRVWKDSKGLASKLYSFRHDPGSERTDDKYADKTKSHSEHGSSNLDDLLNGLNGDSKADSVPDLQSQVVWLKVELCRLLEEKQSAILRAEELETALMELVEEDNRLELSAQIEQLEQEVAELSQVLSDKREQETAMLQVLMRVEQEQKLTEDARLSAEHDAAAQRYAVHVLEDKYEKAMAQLAQMEKRVVMAETMLEATLQYERGQTKAASPRFPHNQGTPPDSPQKKTGLLSFGLGWRDRTKAKPSEESSYNNP